ncbi:hypothetical protein Ct61P_03730 [Colletotrichum tofieldiae]|nr:hypothetical protein Ct61P_03730 [Colletotrichum tofieldiae]
MTTVEETAMPAMAPLLSVGVFAPRAAPVATVVVAEEAAVEMLLRISEADVVKEARVVVASLLRSGGLVGLGLSLGVLRIHGEDPLAQVIAVVKRGRG